MVRFRHKHEPDTDKQHKPQVLPAAIPGAADPNVSLALQAVVARRDELTSDMAQANAEVKTKLAEVYADLFRLAQTP